MAKLENLTADGEKLLALISTSGRTRKAPGVSLRPSAPSVPLVFAWCPLSRGTPPQVPQLSRRCLQVPGTSRQVPETPRQVPGTPRQVPGTPRQVPGTARQVPGTARQVVGTARQVPGTFPQVPGTRPQVPGMCRQVLGTPSQGAISVAENHFQLPGPKHLRIRDLCP